MIQVSVLTEGNSLTSLSQRETGHCILINSHFEWSLQLSLIGRPLKMPKRKKKTKGFFRCSTEKLNCFWIQRNDTETRGQQRSIVWKHFINWSKYKFRTGSHSILINSTTYLPKKLGHLSMIISIKQIRILLTRTTRKQVKTFWRSSQVSQHSVRKYKGKPYNRI